MENPKMSKKVAGFFAKKGEKKLAAHEYREAAGKEEDTPSIAKREMKALKGAPAGMKNYEKKEHKAMGMKKGGMAGCYAKGGEVKKYAEGGSYSYNPSLGGLPQPKKPKPYTPSAGDLNEKAGGDQEFENRSQSRGPGRGPMSRNGMKPKKYAAGGMVKADGCASKGKTRGRFI
jgi:hypothetical protein